MPCSLRIEFTHALYHVTARGNRWEAIHEDDLDRRLFLEVRGEGDFNWLVNAYCLMINHNHLLVETPDDTLSADMKAAPSWDKLQQQVYLGDASFVSRMLSKVGQSPELEAPREQRRARPMPLAEVVARQSDRDAAIAAAHATGHYSHAEIAAYFGLHFTTIGRMVRRFNLGAKT